MVTIPWFVRFGFDCTLYMIPISLVAMYPKMGFTYFSYKRRQARRKGFDDVKLRNTVAYTPEQVLEIRQNTRFSDRLQVVKTKCIAISFSSHLASFMTSLILFSYCCVMMMRCGSHQCMHCKDVVICSCMLIIQTPAKNDGYYCSP
eukprot:TRINITY_DN299_c0_g1_i1.p1 TRINITY_DN299_c0_g1~~TRINITY_DN299_c0_g1_i1.p1  ORF type:complete len:146 (+),score=6.42 TRINITY_DN299_c0_g1_i1:181-618(+)